MSDDNNISTRHDEAINKEDIQNKVSSSVTLRDIYEWRRKDLSVGVLVVATAIWVVMELYHYNLIPLASWLAIFAVASAFIWGNILRLFGK